LDLPLDAAALAGEIARQPWCGLFLGFDYGKSWRELIEATPQGTVRAYRQHQQSTHLLAYPGEQDLTCHVCWDWLGEELVKQHFTVDSIESQEAFFVKNAGSALARIMEAEASHLSSRKSGLLQLLHPSGLGQKFQVLSAWRDEI
jgi:SAM-dependent MidA family methyltransferase